MVELWELNLINRDTKHVILLRKTYLKIHCNLMTADITKK
nr:unnamed protein product [Callosobruchus chinensis]